MSYEDVSKQCTYEVSALVMEALDSIKSIGELAFMIGVDERTIRRWRDGIGDPKYSHYRMLRKVVEGGEDDSSSVFLRRFCVFFLWTKTPLQVQNNVLECNCQGEKQRLKASKKRKNKTDKRAVTSVKQCATIKSIKQISEEKQMNEMKKKLTIHAEERMHERLVVKSLSKKERQARLAYERGIGRNDEKSVPKKMKSYIIYTEKKEDCTEVKIYDGALYIFGMDRQLITVYKLSKEWNKLYEITRKKINRRKKSA